MQAGYSDLSGNKHSGPSLPRMRSWFSGRLPSRKCAQCAA